MEDTEEQWFYEVARQRDAVVFRISQEIAELCARDETDVHFCGFERPALTIDPHDGSRPRVVWAEGEYDHVVGDQCAEMVKIDARVVMMAAERGWLMLRRSTNDDRGRFISEGLIACDNGDDDGGKDDT